MSQNLDNQQKAFLAVADQIANSPSKEGEVEVVLTHDVVVILSDELYQSPVKAIEELVVNAYDANAITSRLFVPEDAHSGPKAIIVFDDGDGMDEDGLKALWLIGKSNKREEEVQKLSQRKLIGRFGIGKLASYTVARKITYISKKAGKTLSVAVDFRQFQSEGSTPKPVQFPIVKINDLGQVVESADLKGLLQEAGISSQELVGEHWTLVLLEDLKPKAAQIALGRLRWVISSALPLKSNFKVYLNGAEVTSSKEDVELWVSFPISDLPKERLASLKENTGEEWQIRGDAIFSPSFPAGIKAETIIAKATLSGKSDDLQRSHGFFIKVRDRLVNENDALFGIKKALEHGAFSRFRCDMWADDLDKDLKAARENIEDSKAKKDLHALMREIFNEANSRYNKEINKPSTNKKKEGERSTVSPQLVEWPVADFILSNSNPDPLNASGSEANNEWFYVDTSGIRDPKEIAAKLYNEERSKYHYFYTANGKASRVVKYDPASSKFWINQDHELVIEYGNDTLASRLLEDFVTAEVMLEIYLKERGVASHVVGSILEQRDRLLRGLAKDHPFSFSSVAQLLRDSSNDKYELEIALVAAARSIGFVATHVSNAHQADGLARYIDYRTGERTITLEAKSSIQVPSLSAIDFAGLQEHMVNIHHAQGCLLVCPDYPGQSQEDSAAANRARNLRISCWTVEQLAAFIEKAQSHHFNAETLLNIVLNNFAPDEVTIALNSLFDSPKWSAPSLYRAIIDALKSLQERAKNKPRTLDMIWSRVTDSREFRDVSDDEISTALSALAGASRGGLKFNTESKQLHIFVSLEELERRLSSLLERNNEGGRRKSNFKNEE